MTRLRTLILLHVLGLLLSVPAWSGAAPVTVTLVRWPYT